MTESSARYEERLDNLIRQIETHTSQTVIHFTALTTQLSILCTRMDAILLREARKDGEYAGMRKSVAVLAGVVSFIVTAVGIAVQAYFG